MTGANPAVPPAEASLGRKVALGAAVSIVGRLLLRLISVINTLILARLLMPEDFGLVALAAVAFTVVDIATSLNYAMVLVRKETVDKAMYDTAWTMGILRNGLLAALIAGTATWQAEWLGDPRIGPILWVIAATMLLDSFHSIGSIRLQREFRFDLIVRGQVATKVVAFVLVTAMALIWQNYWCLVLGNLFSRLFSIPYSYILAPHRPGLSLRHWRELFHFSKWSFALNFVTMADGQGPNLVIGRMAGLPALGQFNFAYQIGATPVTELAVPVRGPIYSGYAKVAHEAATLRRHFLEGFAVLVAFVTPMSVGIALVAPEVERIALGPNWAGTWPLLALCALYALFDSLAVFCMSVFTLKDRLARQFVIYASLTALRVPCVVAGAAWHGAEGAVAAMLATSAINLVVWHHLTGRLLGHTLADVAGHVWRTVAAAAAMAAAVLALRAALPAADGSFLGAMALLAPLAAVGAAVHVAAQLALWRLAGAPSGPERRGLDLVLGAWRRRRRAVPAAAE